MAARYENGKDAVLKTLVRCAIQDRIAMQDALIGRQVHVEDDDTDEDVFNKLLTVNKDDAEYYMECASYIRDFKKFSRNNNLND